MKKYLLILMVFFLTSCYEKGEVRQKPEKFIEIHGKVYVLMSIVPCDGCYPIWVMYPEDSNEAQPTVLNWTEKHGKTTSKFTVVKVE